MPSDVTTFVYGEEPPVPAFQFGHDREKRLFILTWSDGRIEKFRDNPARHLWSSPIPKPASCGPSPNTACRCLFICAGRNARWGEPPWCVENSLLHDGYGSLTVGDICCARTSLTRRVFLEFQFSLPCRVR